MVFKKISLIVSSLMLPAMLAHAKEQADVILRSADIVTVNDKQPTAQAVAIKKGKIIAVGTEQEVMVYQSSKTKLIDLGGKTLVPGFIDAHGHIFNSGIQALSANLLAEPDGKVKDIPSLQETLRTWQNGASAKAIGWMIGFGYDDSQLKEQRHPTKDDLDQISSDIPIVIIHQSGHLGALNSKALELVKINANTKNPEGGVIRRKEGTQEPNGVLEETAFFAVLFPLLNKLSPKSQEIIAQAGQDLYLRFGFTTAQEGRSTTSNNDIWIALAKKKKLSLDIVSYPDIVDAKDSMKSPYVSKNYINRFRIGGVKLNLDGSPQGKTAWLTEAYYKAPEGQKTGYLGYGTFTDKQATEYVDLAYANKWQILAHVNGDAAIDQYISAVRAAVKKYGKADRRTVAIHAQTSRKDQVLSMKELDIMPSFFPMHTYYWGDWYLNSVLGTERGQNISPTGWALENNMTFTIHHDAPVAFPDSMRVLSSAVTRITRGSGQVLGAEHRISPINALKAITLWAAYQHFEEKNKGSIEVGKVADFVVLSDNPIKIDPLKIADIKVLETIKAGQSVYKKNTDNATTEQAISCSDSQACFKAMAPTGAKIVGEELHIHDPTRENENKDHVH